MKELEDLKRLSYRLACDPELVQGQGGNTSEKIGDSIYIKSSGLQLIDAYKNDIFMEIQSANGACDNLGSRRGSKRASIELPMHQLMEHRFVLHTHCVNTITHSICKEHRGRLEERLTGYNWEYIEYFRPGKELCDAITLKTKGEKRDILVLESHGIVVGGECAERAYELHMEVRDRLYIQPRPVANVDFRLMTSVIERKPGYRIPRTPEVHSLGIDDVSYRLSKGTPIFPDLAVFCGEEIPHFDSVDDFIKKEGREDIAIIRGVGCLLAENASSSVEDVLLALALVLARIGVDTEILRLSGTECRGLYEWEAEKYRRSLNRKD